MAYHGASAAGVSTAPLSIAVPGPDGEPIILDMASGAMSMGQLRLAKQNQTPLPAGLALDANGQPTTDPLQASIPLPMAGPKGYGMALVAELLGEAILGQAMDGMNWICIAIDLSRFRGRSAYRAAAEACLSELRACPPAPGFDKVQVPGEMEALCRLERLRNGIPIPPNTLTALRALGLRLGVDVQDLVVA